MSQLVKSWIVLKLIQLVKQAESTSELKAWSGIELKTMLFGQVIKTI